MPLYKVELCLRVDPKKVEREEHATEEGVHDEIWSWLDGIEGFELDYVVTNEVEEEEDA